MRVVSLIAGRGGCARPGPGRDPVEPEPGAAEGDARAGGQLHLRGQQRRGRPRLQASRRHAHV